MVKVEIEDLPEIMAELDEFSSNVADSTQDTLEEVGRKVQSEAKLRCPLKHSTLSDSIMLFKKRGVVIVGIVQGTALQYANKIHNERFKEDGWHYLGKQSRAKNVDGTARVGEKFIDRAYDENKDEIDSKFEKGINAEVKQFNGDN